jgi:hypothetical protein
VKIVIELVEGETGIEERAQGVVEDMNEENSAMFVTEDGDEIELGVKRAWIE